ncbi:uncharacterized protein ACIBXB_022315 [Morphnus guianensis]
MVGLYIFLLGLVLPQFLMAFAWRSSVSIRGILLPMRRMRALIALREAAGDRSEVTWAGRLLWSSRCRGEGKAPSPHPTDFPLASTAQHRLLVLGQSGKILAPPWCEALQPAKPFLSFLAALCPCVRSQSRPARSEDRGRVTGTVPAAVTTFVAIGTSLLKRLQDHEGDRVETYRELESVLWGDDGCLTSGVVNRLIAEALSDMRAAQGVTGDVKMAASDVLVALARSHFHFVMSELQSHLKAMRKVPDEIVLLTLGKMARRYALRCIPFVGMTLLALRAVLTQVGSGEVLHAVCSGECRLLGWGPRGRGGLRCLPVISEGTRWV